jgi:hypothetical protein
MAVDQRALKVATVSPAFRANVCDLVFVEAWATVLAAVVRATATQAQLAISPLKIIPAYIADFRLIWLIMIFAHLYLPWTF